MHHLLILTDVIKPLSYPTVLSIHVQTQTAGSMLQFQKKKNKNPTKLSCWEIWEAWELCFIFTPLSNILTVFIIFLLKLDTRCGKIWSLMLARPKRQWWTMKQTRPGVTLPTWSETLRCAIIFGFKWINNEVQLKGKREDERTRRFRSVRSMYSYLCRLNKLLWKASSVVWQEPASLEKVDSCGGSLYFYFYFSCLYLCPLSAKTSFSLLEINQVSNKQSHGLMSSQEKKKSMKCKWRLNLLELFFGDYQPMKHVIGFQ